VAALTGHDGAGGFDAVSDGKAGVLFADVSGSTALYSDVGDELARSLIGGCLARMGVIAGQFQGRVVKTVGDEVMCVFPAPDAMVLAACAMQNRAVAGKGRCLSLRIGLNFGPVIEDADGDVFGNTVNLAARMAALARPGQILTGEDAVHTLKSDDYPAVRLLDVAKLKGFSDLQSVYEILWRPQEVTRLFAVAPGHAQGGEGAPAMLSLTWSGSRLDMRLSGEPVALGRSPDADIQILSDRVSRVHCLIEPRRNGFFLSDQSTNGTFVRAQGGDEIFLRGEGTFLIGTGTITLGLPERQAGVEVVRYVMS
jgi:class 3 adenylate cyclase